MKQDMVTFYCPREKPTYKVSGPGGRELLVYWREPSDFRTADQYEYAASDLQKRMPSGGLIVEICDDNAKPVVVINVLPSQKKNYEPPRHVLRLRIDRSPTLENLKGESFSLELGDHLLVPVDLDAEDHLKRLQADLKYLSVDKESSVFNVLRRPSLEWRIARIERSLTGRLKPGPPSARESSSRWWRLLRPPTARGRVLRAILLAIPILALAGFIGHMIPRGRSPAPQPPKATTEQKPAPPPVAPQNDFDAAVAALLQAAANSGKASVRDLVAAHKVEPGSSNEKRNLALVLLKLNALGDVLLTEKAPDLTTPEELTATRAALLKGVFSPARLHLLTKVCCDAFSIPGLPQYNGNAKIELKNTPGCDKVDPKLVLGGLKAWQERLARH